MNLIKKRMRKMAGFDSDVVYELSCFNDPSLSVISDLTSKALKDKAIDYDMADMPAGEFADAFIPYAMKTDIYKKLIKELEEKVNADDSEEPMDMGDLVWEFEKALSNEVMSLLSDWKDEMGK